MIYHQISFWLLFWFNVQSILGKYLAYFLGLSPFLWYMIKCWAKNWILRKLWNVVILFGQCIHQNFSLNSICDKVTLVLRDKEVNYFLSYLFLRDVIDIKNLLSYGHCPFVGRWQRTSRDRDRDRDQSRSRSRSFLVPMIGPGPGPGNFWSQLLVTVTVPFEMLCRYHSRYRSWSRGLVIEIFILKNAQKY